MIRIEGLSKAFGKQQVLQDVTFDIDDGKFIGIYGKSGIGKSTLAKLLCGVQKPDAGTITMDNTLLCSPHAVYNRKQGVRIQMVYQQPYASLDPSQKLYRGFTELIRYHHFAKDQAATEQLIDDVLAQAGLQRNILAHLPHQISGGEAQRVALARCLLFQPRLLILDEATSMLDVSTQANVLAAVKRAAAKDHSSVMLISHDAELVSFLCDQIFVFDDKHTLKER